MSISAPVHSFLDLPPEVADHALRFCSILDIARFSCTSRDALRVSRRALSARSSITNKDVMTSSTARNIAIIRFIAEHCFSLETFSVSLPGQGCISSIALETMVMLAHKTSHLVELNLVNIDLNDRALVAISWAAPNLAHIMLGSTNPLVPNNSFGDVGMIAIVERCSKLESVGLVQCRGCSDHFLNAMGLCCKGMKQLMLNACPHITEFGLSGFANLCQDLELLDLAGMRLLLGEVKDVSEIWSSFSKNLKEIRLKKGCRFEKASLIQFFSDATKLESVELHGHLVTDQILTMIAAHCQGLQSLILKSSRVTSQGLTLLTQQCPNIKEIKLIGKRPCRNMQSITLSMQQYLSPLLPDISKNCKSLTSVEVEGLSTVPVSEVESLLNSDLTEKLENLSLSWSDLRKPDGSYDWDGVEVGGCLCRCRNLRSLRMESYPGNADTVARAISSLRNSLTCLSLSKTNLTDDGLKSLIHANIHIRQIDLSCCNDISSEGLEKTVKAIGQYWQEVKFYEVTAVSDAVVDGILNTCHEIEYLNIVMPPGTRSRITESGFRRLSAAVQSRYFIVERMCGVLRGKSLDWRRH
ncbi:hypothetical protein BSKO_13750 [Bryopsis sp. KO-2023]|nr:hypothetical protein BSKO_13750 [Bryopsis sp. KO-2023]